MNFAAQIARGRGAHHVVGMGRTAPFAAALRRAAAGKAASRRNPAAAAGWVVQHRTFTRTRSIGEPDKKDVASPKGDEPPAPKSRAQKMWIAVRDGAVHTYHGFRLLATEVNISTSLLFRLLRGKTLSRRQQRQLRRTSVDLLRLLPFSFFLIVPFMEIFLPVALKLFPNMLPSTFSNKFAEEEKRAKLLKVRIEVAKFLQEAVKEQAQSIGSDVTSSDLFQSFLNKVREGHVPSRSETIEVAKLFQEDLTITNLSRPQLVSLCRFMNINAFGTDNFLRFTVRKRLEEIKRDDVIIAKEGIDSLNLPELTHAAISRAIYTEGASEEQLRQELSRWLDLRLNESITGVLLVLSKAFSYSSGPPSEAGSLYDSLARTLVNLPQSALHEVEIELDSAKSNKDRLDLVKEQQELIQEEEKQESKEEERTRLEREKEHQQSLSRLSPLKLSSKFIPGTSAKIQITTAPGPEEHQTPLKEEPNVDLRLTKEQASELGSALTMLAAKSIVEKELRELQDLKKSLKVTRREANQASEEAPKPKSSLERKINDMVLDLEQRVLDFDKDVGQSMNLLKVDEHGRIHIDDLHKAFELIAHRPTDAEIDSLCEKLDLDKDGFVPVNDLISLAETEGIGRTFDSARIDEFKDTMNEARSLTDQARGLKLKREDVVSD